jgi:hypothetical protein
VAGDSCSSFPQLEEAAKDTMGRSYCIAVIYALASDRVQEAARIYYESVQLCCYGLCSSFPRLQEVAESLQLVMQGQMGEGFPQKRKRLHRQKGAM